MDIKPEKRLSRKQIFHIAKRYNIKIDSFNLDGFGRLDVHGDVRVCKSGLKKLPLKFGKVTGNFYCHLNNLTTLDGAPFSVGGDFNCSDNKLQNLKFSPRDVAGDYFCQNNELKSLEGAPTIIHGSFNCFLNQLKTLRNAPKEVYGSFYCFPNELHTLEGAPSFVGKSFHVGSNPLNDLKGCPSFIGDLLTFDSCISSINIGSKNSSVNQVKIQIQGSDKDFDSKLHQVIIDNEKFLPIIFKYFSNLNLYEDGDVSLKSLHGFALDNFKDIILDIKEGLR